MRLVLFLRSAATSFVEVTYGFLEKEKTISGYGVSGYVAGRIDLVKSFFFELEAKGGYIDLPDIFTNGRSKDRAS